MFNCTELFNTTPTVDVAVCLKKCDYLMAECLCRCLEYKLYEDDDVSISNQLLLLLGITGAFLLSGICVTIIRCRGPRNQVNNIPVQVPDIEPPPEINYYDPAPKYEDLPNIVNPSPPYHPEEPPKYDDC